MTFLCCWMLFGSSLKSTHSVERFCFFFQSARASNALLYDCIVHSGSSMYVNLAHDHVMHHMILSNEK